MRSYDKLAILFLIALLPLALAATVWSISGLPSERAGTGFIVLATAFVILASHLRIQLPRTNLHLSLSDAMVMFALIYFGGELAVLLGTAAAVASALVLRRENRHSVLGFLINTAISVITVFVTAIGVYAIFGTPEAIRALPKAYFIFLIALLTFVPFVLNSLLLSAHLAMKGDKSYWQVLKVQGADAILVYFGAAIMAGLTVMALTETNIFLFFTVVGFFGILQIAFRRYRSDYAESRKQARRSERERSRLTARHITELEHYVGELERKSKALRESREKYRHEALHDSLTGLPNRNKFIETINKLLVRSRKIPEYSFALLYLDLLRFKTVNDSLGRSVGDQLISHVAGRLTELVKEDDLVGRFSGDEFAILLPNAGNIDDAIAFAETVISRIEEPFELDKRQIFTGVSMGIAMGSREYANAGDLLRDADIAMYRAKERNRSCVVFEKKMHIQAVSLLELETDLRLAVERNEFELFYQPIVELDSTRLRGVEALVRWSHPRFGQMQPEQFIDVSEATGLILPMTLQILESACTQLKEWNASAGRFNPIFVSVNLSGKHFTHPNVVEHIETILKKTNVNPRAIKLEITETAVMENAERAATVLGHIKDLGVQLSIDDFGTGYSSLSYLQRFPIDTLKIDRSFVRSMEDGRQNGEIVRAILALADALKLSVVAEGIESVHQLHQLRILQCRYGQGYLFSPALPASEILPLIHNHTRWRSLMSGSSFAILPPVNELYDELVQ